MGGKLGWKLVGGVAAVLAGLVAQRGVTLAWEAATGRTPPERPENPDIGWPEAIGWAAASGAVVGLAKLIATRRAAAYFRRSTGNLPPGFGED